MYLQRDTPTLFQTLSGTLIIQDAMSHNLNTKMLFLGDLKNSKNYIFTYADKIERLRCAALEFSADLTKTFD